MAYWKRRFVQPLLGQRRMGPRTGLTTVDSVYTDLVTALGEELRHQRRCLKSAFSRSCLSQSYRAKAEDVSAVRKRCSSDLPVREGQQLAPLLAVRWRGSWPLVEAVNTILRVLKNGYVWWDLPGGSPSWGMVQWCFAEWEAVGSWPRVGTCLNVGGRERAEKKPGLWSGYPTRNA